jgi:hypothetical protein
MEKNNQISTSKIRRLLRIFYVLPVLFALGICAILVYNRAAHRPPPVRIISGAPFASVKIGPLEARFFTQGNALHAAGDDVFIEFRDAQNKLVDVGAVSLMLVLKTPGTVMHSISKVMRTATPGQYRTTVQPGVAGDWTATLEYTGPPGQDKASFPIKVI